MGYGDRVYQAHGQELIRVNRERIELITWAFTQFWMVDVFPLRKPHYFSARGTLMINIYLSPKVRFLPSWFPGARFRKIGETATRQAKQIRFWPYEMVLNASVSTILQPSLWVFSYSFQKSGKADDSVLSRFLNNPSFSNERLRDSVALMYTSMSLQ